MATVASRTSAHLWVVGLVSLLWSLIGVCDYVLTQTHNAWYLSMFPADQLAYFEAFPAWTVVFWALGVWGALAGAVLLLLRNGWAVHAYRLSLVGIVVTTVYQFILTRPPASMMTPVMLALAGAIVVLAIAFLYYATRMRAQGVLR